MDRPEAAAERLVPVHELPERSLQGDAIERAAQPEIDGHIVAVARGAHLVEEPEAPLGKRKRTGSARRLPLDTGDGLDAELFIQQKVEQIVASGLRSGRHAVPAVCDTCFRASRAFTSSSGMTSSLSRRAATLAIRPWLRFAGGQARGETGDGRLFEDLAQRNVDAQCLAQPEGQLCREKAMAAQLEEVVRAAGALDVQHARVHVGDDGLEVRARSDVSALKVGTGRAGPRQRAKIDLAGRIARQVLHQNEGRRHHEVRQRDHQGPSQLRNQSRGGPGAKRLVGKWRSVERLDARGGGKRVASADEDRVETRGVGRRGDQHTIPVEPGHGMEVLGLGAARLYGVQPGADLASGKIRRPNFSSIVHSRASRAFGMSMTSTRASPRRKASSTSPIAVGAGASLTSAAGPAWITAWKRNWFISLREEPRWR